MPNRRQRSITKALELLQNTAAICRWGSLAKFSAMFCTLVPEPDAKSTIFFTAANIRA